MWKDVVGAGGLFILSGGITVAMAYDVADVPHGGTVVGRVAFHGDPPAPRVFEVEKDPDLCGAERQLTDVAVREGWLQGAVVVLEGVTKGKPFADRSFKEDPPGEGKFEYAAGDTLSLEVRAKKCSWGPFTGVLAPDQPIRFQNEDPVKHTLHTYVTIGHKGLVLRTIHNRDISPHAAFDRAFTARKLNDSHVVKLTCDRHNFMQNWLYVVETPYFSISNQDGAFTIDHVPPGRYQLLAWHPTLGLQRQAVTVEADQTVDADFTFQQQDR